MAVKLKMEAFGYKEFADTQTGASGLFIKEVNSGYYLTLGLVICELREQRNKDE